MMASSAATAPPGNLLISSGAKRDSGRHSQSRHVDLVSPPETTADEIRERMSGTSVAVVHTLTSLPPLKTLRGDKIMKAFTYERVNTPAEAALALSAYPAQNLLRAGPICWTDEAGN